MWFTSPATLLKSHEKSDRLEFIAMASDETLDDDFDNILADAFNDDVRQTFMRLGHIDWDHITIRGATELERATALIGTPTSFYEDGSTGQKRQIIEFYLHFGNPYVDDVVLPAMSAGSDRIKCSIGGKIRGYQPNAHFRTNSQGQPIGGRSVHEVSMNHLALTPAYKAVNKATEVWQKEMAKSGQLVRFEKSADLCKSLRDGFDFQKSMEAGGVTDSAKIVGAQALQPQDLEQKKVVTDLYRASKGVSFPTAAGRHVLYDILDGELTPNEEDIRARGIIYGMTDPQADAFSRLVIVKLMPRILSIKRRQSLLKNKEEGVYHGR